MISDLFNYLYKNLISGNSRKRRLSDETEAEPVAKLSRQSEDISCFMVRMAEDGKENQNSKINLDDEVCLVEEVRRPNWVSPRKTIRGSATTSTPISSTASSSSREWCSPATRAQRMVAMAREDSKEATTLSKSQPDSDIHLVKHMTVSSRGSQANMATTSRSGSLHHRRKTLADRLIHPFRQTSLEGSRKFFKRAVPHAAIQYREMLQYRKLLATYAQPTSNFLASFTLAEIQPRKSSSPQQIPIVDLTQDVRVNRELEAKPSTPASRAAENNEITILDVRSVERVNSLEDCLRLNPVVAESTNVDQILQQHAMNTAEKRRLASVEETKLAVLSPHNQNAINDVLEYRLRRYMKITEPPIIEIEEEEPSYFLPTLTDEQEGRIDAALKPNPAGEVLSEKFSLRITRHDMTTLKGSNWLNDEVINFHMNLLMERGKKDSMPSVYAFNTFFYPKLISSGHSALKRWTRKVDIFSYDMIFVPVHLGVHWCMAVIDFRVKEVRYYDSMGARNDKCLGALLSYLEVESLDKKKTRYDTSDWKAINADGIPEQLNGSDCGVFACTFAEHLARDQPLLFTQEHMPYLRRKMVLEILDGELLT